MLDEMDTLHVERNQLVKTSYLDVQDFFKTDAHKEENMHCIFTGIWCTH
jgi:hypothetical protein